MTRRPEPGDYYTGGPLNVRQDEPTSEAELFAGYATLEDAELVAFGVARTLADIRRLSVATASTVALNTGQLAELSTDLIVVRELVELLVDWAGARDRIPADTADGEP